ncbi:MAG: efflux RND transporter permease subunit [Candidatus Competibacteraceae bacterium]|jgi:multidrug efflux pump|nr:efflux RND transporter permease subunit [Candidatus Competibacteraceae bacterium]
MLLSRLAIERPVFATVISLLLIVFGIGAVLLLPVREYPDVDPPIVSVFTVYPGASAAVVDREITETIEDVISSIEGINTLTSTSRDEVSQITLEFILDRDLEAAAADVRDKIGQVKAELPEGAEDPVISKTAGDADPIMWLTLTSERRNRLELTDYAERNLVDPLSVVPGVARVIIGGGRRYAMRIWLDPQAMAARGITPNDIVARLRAQNVELPAGRLESEERELSVRATTRLNTPQDFQDLVLRQVDGDQITLGEVARVEIGAQDYRSAVRVDGQPAVGLGVVRQSESNTLSVAQGIKNEVQQLNATLPDDIQINIGYDASTFIEGSLREVMKTLAITGALVIGVIFLFLSSLRATLIPAATLPVSLLAAFTALYVFGYSINTITLLALVLAIGLVVDDAIVVLENVFRHNEQNEPRLLAAARGADQVGVAVIATTLVLLAVFVPLLFLAGDVGRLFTEFAVILGAAVAFSSLVALSLGAMLSSKLIDAERLSQGRLYRITRRGFAALSRVYRCSLRGLTRVPMVVVVLAFFASAAVYSLYQQLPKELAPTEDRGTIIIPIEAPQGASFSYTQQIVKRIEAILQPLTDDAGPVRSIISIIGLAQQGPAPVNEALLIIQLKPWGQRQQRQQAIVGQLQAQLLSIPGAQAFAVNPPSLGQSGFSAPVQFVVSASNYSTAQSWAQRIMAQVGQIDGLVNPRLDYKETKPQTELSVNRRKAAALGVSVRQIGEALRIMFGEDDVTDYIYNARTYDVIPRIQAQDRTTPDDLNDIQVRTNSGALVPLGSVVDYRTLGAPNELKRVDRLPSVTLSASLAPGVALGDALAQLDNLAQQELPAQARINYLGRSQEYKESAGRVYVAFVLALVIVFLVLAAQFESFIQPIIIMFPVPLAVTGGLLALVVFGQSFNIYSQIALILLIGIMAKNAILVVEFANQLRDEGYNVRDAIIESAAGRLRPVLMTSIATTFGAVPLALATGPGAEGRTVIGVVIISGTVFATLLTLFVIPGLYQLLAPHTQPVGAVAQQLQTLETDQESREEPAQLHEQTH